MANEVQVVEAEELTREEKEKLAIEMATNRAREFLEYAADAEMDESQVQELLNRNGFDGAANIDDLGEAGFKARIWGPYNSIISI